MTPMTGTRLRAQELAAIRSSDPRRYNAAYGRSIAAFRNAPTLAAASAVMNDRMTGLAAQVTRRSLSGTPRAA